MELTANQGKNLIIEIGGKKYARYPVKTHLVTETDNILDVVEKYAKPHLEKGDVLFIGEKCVSITQGRAYEMDKIKPGKLAKFLVKFVTKSPYGIGLGSAETMQLAVEEVGAPRILLAAFAAAITKSFGFKGMFYRVAGPQARGVDGPVAYAIPPYNNRASKIPLNAGKVAKDIEERINIPVAIVDACDMGAWVVGSTKDVPKKLLLKALKDNPLGQTNQQTPMGILREVK
ncbi:MAG: coenzyme F420-0:L-glutamate ligase [Candidatus Paceibacterota bacterium]|jgi:F420-0:gamma-glutamyl ligase-like protein